MLSTEKEYTAKLRGASGYRKYDANVKYLQILHEVVDLVAE